LRVVMALVGVLFGVLLVVLAFFGATFKKSVAEWDAKSLTLLALGVGLGGTVVWAAVRPSRRSLGVLAAWAMAIVLLEPAL
jgi:hypothetical protein